MRIRSTPLAIGALIIVFSQRLACEQLGGPLLPEGGKFSLIEKSDLRRYEKGKFVGLEYREARGILSWDPVPEGTRVQGTFYVLEELDHEGSRMARRIDEEVPVSYSILADGKLENGDGGAYPSVRGFPVLPAGEIEVGQRWQASGMRVVDPLKGGAFTRIPFYCDYRYEGEQDLQGKRVRAVTAKYAIRYKRGDDPSADPRIQSASGSHTVSIQIAIDSGALSFMRDLVDETYQIDGDSVAYKGFTLTWFNSVTPLNREDTASKIAKKLKESGTGDVEIVQKKEGVSVSLNKIHFIADQAVVLPEELPRLSALADALKSIPGRSFRVIGHTARVGTERSQYELSVLRAKAIVDFLVSRGISAERFLYEGRGGTEPVAPNDTEENMARNRRVEIVVLEN